MGFRLRLALFLVATLVTIQLLTALLVYAVTRNALIDEGERQLVVAARAFVRQLDDISERVATNVQVLALDYALRAAIAQRDQGTVRSVLRNHGRRVGAERMLLIGLDGQIEADTSDENASPRTFPYPELLESAFETRSAAVVALEGRAYWMVVVPVHAPQPVGLIAAGIPIDTELLQRMQSLSALPQELELVVRAADGTWSPLAHGTGSIELGGSLAAAHPDLPGQPTLIVVDGREYVALATRLNGSPRQQPIAAVLGYSLDEALAAYRPVGIAWASLLALGLGAGLVGALLIARGVARPVEALAETARRIEAGDYSPPPPIRQRGELGHLAAAFANMTQAIAEREERIRHQAAHDAVTGLPNRRAAESEIQRALEAGAVDGAPAATGALLMIGLKRLTETIQTMGHAIGDGLMRDAALRVRRLAGDRLAARAMDTQLLLWAPGIGQPEAIALAFRVMDVLGEPYREGDLAIDLGPAVGIALCPEHGRAASPLLQHADVALFAAVAAENPVAVYDPATDPHRPERLSLMADLREALDRDQLELHYQPRIHLASLTIDGAEGLVRWQHPRRGFVAPDTFITLAEETGNIRRLTRWALATSVAQARRWNGDGRNLRLAVNLSARDLDDVDLPRRVGELLSVHGVTPDRIMLEITESAVMGEPDTAIRVLRRLADDGIELAIDDFGVGQSSFAYLRRLPVREIKIDQSFIRKLGDDAEDRTIVRSIVELGHRLGYRVTSEGVETQGALDYLVEIGCDHVQGYFISGALAPPAFERFVSESRWGATMH